MRCVATIAGMLSFFFAVKYLPLSTAVVIYNTMPFFTTLFGGVFLRERISYIDLGAMIFSLGGVAVVALATATEESGDPKNVYFGLLGITLTLLLFSGAFILSRKANASTHFLVIPFYIGVTYIVFHGLACLVQLISGWQLHNFAAYS